MAVLDLQFMVWYAIIVSDNSIREYQIIVESCSQKALIIFLYRFLTKCLVISSICVDSLQV